MPIDKIPKESILAVIEKLGPCQPIDIRKELQLGDTFLIGALLSELVADGKLAITKVRRGGSPFYYDIQKPETLDKVSQYLNEKDRRTYAMLKQQEVMREDAQDPLVRVGLQNMPDFSRRIDIDGDAYWRYFLTSDDDAKKMLKKGKKTPEDKGTSEEIQKKEKEEPRSTPSPKKSESEEQEEKQKKAQKDSAQQKLPGKGDELEGNLSAAAEQPVPAQKSDETKEEKKGKKRSSTPRVKKPAPGSAPTAQEWLAHDTLYEKVQKFAAKQSAVVTQPVVIKPNSELTCVLTGDSAYGKMSVVVLALNKKKVMDKDVHKALLQARGGGMPLLVLSVDPIPAKLAAAFEYLTNVSFKTF